MKPQDPHQERLERCTRRRLARLAAMPVDTSRLKRRIEAAIAEQREPSPAYQTLLRWWRPVTSAAAAVIIALTVWTAVDTSSVAMAGPAQLAQLHYDVTRGLTPALPATSIEEANRLLAEQGAGQVAGQLPGEVMSCCLQEVSGVTLSCVLIKQDQSLITVVVADGGAMHSPVGEAVERSGRRFTLHQANGINMAMIGESGRWACVMGQVPYEQLIEVAAQIDLKPKRN